MQEGADSIEEKALIGVGWNGISMVVRQGFQFVVTAVLARLLQPSDFGLVGMAAIVTDLVFSVREMGLSAAIIQRKELDDLHLTSVFWATIGGGILLFGICAGVAPLAARFFKNGEVAPILIVSSIGFVISSFGVVHMSSLLRRLEFKAVAIAEVGASVGYGVVSIVLAVLGFGPWALVYGTLAGSLAGVILWWIGFRWTPRLRFSKQKFLEVFKFGANVMGTGVVGNVHQNMDYIIIGRRLGAASLGIYTLAFKLISMPLTRISYMVINVSFPAFSRIQDDDERIRRAYFKTVRYISLLAFPLLAGLLVLAPTFVSIVYGAKWVSAVVPLQIMCLLGMLKSVGATVGSILKSKGRPDIELRYNSILLVGMIVGVLLGSLKGIVGVAAAVTILTAIIFPIFQSVTNRLIGMTMREYLRSLWPAVFCSAVMVLVMSVWVSILHFVLPGKALILLLSSMAIGALVYWVTLRLTRIEEIGELPVLLAHVPLLEKLVGRYSNAGAHINYTGGLK
jgi:PST family polysaccharide transporter